MKTFIKKIGGTGGVIIILVALYFAFVGFVYTVHNEGWYNDAYNRGYQEGYEKGYEDCYYEYVE